MSITDIGPINLLSERLLRYVLIFEYQIFVPDLVVDIRTKISEVGVEQLDSVTRLDSNQPYIVASTRV